MIGVGCVLSSVEESGWKNFTDSVMDVAVVEDEDLFCISDCGSVSEQSHCCV